MAVTILRKTGFFGSWGKLSLMVKDEEIITISEGQTVTFNLPTYPAYLSVKGDPSTAILVSDHQKYILCVHPPFLWAQAMAFSLLFFSLFLCSHLGHAGVDLGLPFAEALQRLRQLERLDLDGVRAFLQFVQTQAGVLDFILRVLQLLLEGG